MKIYAIQQVTRKLHVGDKTAFIQLFETSYCTMFIESLSVAEPCCGYSKAFSSYLSMSVMK